MLAVSCAVHDAPALVVAALGVQAAEPRLVAPFVNCTFPVGPCSELLFEPTTAVNVTCVPEVITPRLLATNVAVCAGVIVTLSVLLVLF